MNEEDMSDEDREALRKLSDLLGVTSASLIEALNKDREGQRRYAEKILIGVTLGSLRDDFFSADLYQKVAEIRDFPDRDILLESLNPIPFLSIFIEEGRAQAAVEVASEIVRWATKDEGELRIVAARGIVEHDKQGRTKHMRLASSGSLVSDVLEGCMLLPKQYSWGNREFMEFVQLEVRHKIKIGNEGFHPMLL